MSKNPPVNNKKIAPAGPMRGGMGMGEKAKDFKKSIKVLLHYLKPQRFLIILALFCAVASTIFAILGPKILGDITSSIQDSYTNYKSTGQLIIDFDLINNIAMWLLVIYAVSSVLNYMQSFIMAGVNARITYQFRDSISQKINRLPLKYFDKNTYGDILSRVTNDIDTISQTLDTSLRTMITSITTIIGVLIIMFTISWQLTLIAVVSVPVTIILAMIVVKFSQKYYRRQQESLGEIDGHIEEIYSAHNIVKVFNGEEKALDEFSVINKKLYKNSFMAQFLSGVMMPIMNFIGNISYVLVCVVGGELVVKGAIKVGVIQSFLMYIRQFNQPISQISSIVSTLQSTAAAAERVFEFLNEEEQTDESNKTFKFKSVKGEVDFENVSFGYNPDKKIIKDFNCHVKPGQKVAIVGPTGAGKTTLVNLLMRFYDFDGDIKVDGHSIKDMNRSYVRKLFGMVLQDTWLFEGTIKENLVYNKKGVSQKTLDKACEAANILHFIKTQPQGYDMHIDEESNLSQGQKQLITIARAMIEDAPMLILDEATSSVDTRTEELIQVAMDKLTQNRTSFVIAHRLSTIKNADLILVMKDGNIIESGNHKQLIAQNGFYAELYNSQFSTSGLDYLAEE